MSAKGTKRRLAQSIAAGSDSAGRPLGEFGLDGGQSRSARRRSVATRGQDWAPASCREVDSADSRVPRAGRVCEETHK